MSTAAQPSSDFRAAVSASEERLCAAVCAHSDVGSGRLYYLERLHRVYDVNVVRRPRLRVQELDSALRLLWKEARARGLEHLLFAGDDLTMEAPLRAAFEQRGFYRDALACMVYDGATVSLRPGIVVRAVAPSEPLRALYRRVHSDEAWYTPTLADEVCEALCLRAVAGALRLYGAYEGEHLVGALGLTHHAGVASLVSVATDPDARGRGVGSTLLAAATQRAAALGVRATYLMTRVHDWPRQWYGRRGFREAFHFESWGRTQAPT